MSLPPSKLLTGPASVGALGEHSEPAVNSPPAKVRRGFLPFSPPKGTRTPQPLVPQALTTIAKESIVTKRVPFGELVWFAELPPTLWLTHNAESESSRRLSFPPIWQRLTTSRKTARVRGPSGANASNRSPGPTLAKTLSLSVPGADLVNNLVALGPRTQPFSNDGRRHVRRNAAALTLEAAQ